ncbi:MAG: ATP-binding protein [Candidatus Obscuribacterales bacterium]
MSLKLSQKFLIVVTVPVIFEIALVGVLLGLRNQAEAQREKEAHAKQLVAHINSILALHMQRSSLLILSHANPSPSVEKRILRCARTMQQEARAIERLASQDAEEEAIWKRILDLISKLDKGFSTAKESYDKGDRDAAAMAWMEHQTFMDDLFQVTDDLARIQKRSMGEQHDQIQTMDQLIFSVLLLSIILSVLVAFGLTAYFNASTARRFYMLTENAALLEHGEEPVHTLEGGDELADLDATFHHLHDSLQLLRRRIRAVIENASEVICTVGEDFTVEDINPAVKQLWGLDPESVIGTRLVDLCDEADRDRFVGEFFEAVQKEEDRRVEAGMRKADGSLSATSWSISWSATDRAFYCVIYDMTEKKRIERMKQDFIAMVSHDLKTPLTAVLLTHEYLEHKLQDSVSDIGMKKLKTANSNINRLMGLVNNILDMERLESGRMEVSPSMAKVCDTVEEAIGSVAGIAQSKQVEIVSEVDGRIEAYIDSNRIVQVLVNLLGNALKFSPGQSRITIAAVEGDDFVRVEVKDQGPGIPQDKLDLVFERFKQADRDDETVRKGTGLGLTICKWIVESHGGSIGVTSEPGKGSTFWFTVPRDDLVA